MNAHWLDRHIPGRPRPLVMGIVNVTPDSFSDGGQFLDPASAVAHAARLAAEGADILDIGGESTRPYGGMQPIDADTEWQRIAPVIDGALRLAVPVSVDTMKAAVASKAVKAGARMINDVWGLQHDPDMARVAADHDVGVVAMHNRDAADPAIDIMADIRAFFTRTLEIADRAGIPRARMILDPGVGFGKTPEQSLTVVARTREFDAFGVPLLVGLSRKRFIAAIDPSEPHQRLGGSLAANLYVAQAGAAVVRVHDVRETVQALKIAAAIARA